MNDHRIRSALLAQVLAPWGKDPNSRVVEEAGMGGCIIDVLVLSSVLHGYEIKSDDDTLKRLPEQVRIFSEVCQFMTLVTTPKYADKALDIIPSWWGLLVANEADGRVSFTDQRRTFMNPGHQPIQVIRLLWNDELKAELKSAGVRGISKLPGHQLADRFYDTFPREDALRRALSAMKARPSWGIKDTTGDGGRGGPLQTVVHRTKPNKTVTHPVRGVFRVREEQLECGHTLEIEVRQFEKLPKRRRCPRCRDGKSA